MSGSRLRHLVACETCHRQYDASEAAAGARFHCDCGALIAVTPPQAHDAAVVRCSSCGAPREGTASSCRFCGSDFTLHERDLHTICPSCATRISNRARFCHACAAAIEPQALVGETTSHPCPACGDEQRLHSRSLDGETLSIFECRRCAGIWIDQGIFQRLEERALERELDWNPLRPGAATRTIERPAADSPLYRRCPTCREFMHRTNYARRSGVIVDICNSHGIWFDHGELAPLLKWVRSGSLTRARRQKILENAELTAARRTAMAPPDTSELSPYRGSLAQLLTKLISAVLR